jgi:CheY-like chemotaxis protein
VEGNRIRLDVTDDGVGMTAVQRERLFRRFDRLGREATGIEGTGIGLALTQKLVEAMDGSIMVDSAQGVGTTVRVTLPSAVAAAPVPSPGCPAATGPTALCGRVLYIEDEAVNALLVQAFMASHPGIELQVAETGEGGLASLAGQRFDLVLLDRGLPDIDGLEVLRRLRQDPRHGSLPVVMLSASAMDQDVMACLQAGATAYWTKPIAIERWGADLAAHLPCARPGSASVRRSA